MDYKNYLCKKPSMPRIKFLVLGFLLLALVSCQPSGEKARDYFNSLMDDQQAVLEKEDVLNQLINIEMQKTLTDSTGEGFIRETDTTSYDAEINVAFSDLCLQIRASLEKVRRTGPFDEDSTLLKPALDLLEAYESLTTKEYKELVEIVKTPAGLYTGEMDQRFTQLTGVIDSTLLLKIDNFTLASEAFAKTYNFDISTGESAETYE